MSASFLKSSGGPTGTQKYATIEPREHKRDGTRRWLIWLHYAGVDAWSPWTTAGLGTLKLVQLLGDYVPILAIDGGTIPGSGTDDGQYTFGNTTVVSRIADAFTWCTDPAKGGGKTDKVFLGGASQAVPGIINYAKANPTKVAAMFGVLPLSDLDDARNNNRPNGWTNATTQASPANTDHICAAHGLTLNTTNDGVHGTSSNVALPAGVNPQTADLSALTMPIKAWRSPGDTTVPTATVTALFVTKLGATVADVSPDSGHTDASLGAVAAADVWAHLKVAA